MHAVSTFSAPRARFRILAWTGIGLALGFFSAASFAQTYIKSDGGCLIHNSLPQANERVSWTGACEKGYATGKGIVRWYLNERLNEVVEATFVAGKMEGECRIDNFIQGSFEGNCKNDLPHGFGTLTRKDGRVQSGTFQNGLFVSK